MTDPSVAAGFEDGLAYIQIDYPPDTDDPARIFRTMARLIDAFHQVDRDLAHAVSSNVEPVLILERVEAGSLRAWLRTAIRQLDDEALVNLDWKPLIGQYLVRGKHRLLSWLDSKNTIRSRAEIVELQGELIELTPSNAVEMVLIEPIPAVRLLEDIRLIAEATQDLRDTDRVTYVSANGDTALNNRFHLTSEEVEDLLTQEIVAGNSRLSLLIKKPDYLGNSRWEFRLGDHTIEAKILDEPWLERFRSGDVPLGPGDALDADVRSEVNRGFEGHVVGNRYFVLYIHGIVRAAKDVQSEMDLR